METAEVQNIDSKFKDFHGLQIFQYLDTADKPTLKPWLVGSYGNYPTIKRGLKNVLLYKGCIYGYLDFVTISYDDGDVLEYRVGEKCIHIDRWPHMSTEVEAEAVEWAHTILDNIKEHLERHVHSSRQTTLGYIRNRDWPDELLQYVMTKIETP